MCQSRRRNKRKKDYKRKKKQRKREKIIKRFIKILIKKIVLPSLLAYLCYKDKEKITLNTDQSYNEQQLPVHNFLPLFILKQKSTTLIKLDQTEKF